MRWASSCLAIALAAPVSGAWEEEPVFRLAETPILDCRASQEGRVCRFSTPSLSASTHYRLEAACASGVRLNGYPLVKDETGFPVTGLLSREAPNILNLPAVCGTARLLATPRFYIVSVKRSQDGSKLLILLENRLDNTSNFWVGAFPADGAATVERSGTIPAESRMLVELLLPAASGKDIAKIELWKAPEAVEGNYRYVETLSSGVSMENRIDKP